jgi:hypothetical protein
MKHYKHNDITEWKFFIFTYWMAEVQPSQQESQLSFVWLKPVDQ